MEQQDESAKAAQGLIAKLKNYLYTYYAPAVNVMEAEFHFSTDEIHKLLLRIYPNEFELTADMVAVWLHEGGFSFYDSGQLRFEWLLKRNK